MTTITATETDLMQRLCVAGDGKQFEVRGGSTHGRSLTVDELIAELLPGPFVLGAAVERLEAGYPALVGIVDAEGEREIWVKTQSQDVSA
ncbi:hypothetical protein [Mycolicibacterium conceptionense]|uniref:hypothetical protein n=1 Tax=Mycolicibacterium conceptionense TaxID=451644 RepID=UPI0002F1018E|nr:hypothetical protein [Mycolicibacterium conceptionense]